MEEEATVFHGDCPAHHENYQAREERRTDNQVKNRQQERPRDGVINRTIGNRLQNN